MRKHIPHPVTRRTSPFAELDILHGGNESAAIEESLTVARDLREVLRDGENILYVNTLVNQQRLEHIMGKRFDHGARRSRNYFVTYMPERFIHKLAAIEGIVEAKGIRYLVLNSFELATLSSRHRAVFMAWIRSMRNRGINVILFTMGCPGRIGTLGALRFSARTINEVGAYLKANDDEAVSAAPEQMPANRISEDEENHEPSEGSGPAIVSMFDDEVLAQLLRTMETEHSDSDSLKTKDLALEMV